MNINSITALSANLEGQTSDELSVKEKLIALGIPEEIVIKGLKAVEDYAKEHNISLVSIKLPDKVKPQKPELKGSDADHKKDHEKFLESLGIPKEVIEKGKEAVKKYAEEHHIKLPEHPKKGTKFNSKM